MIPNLSDRSRSPNREVACPILRSHCPLFQVLMPGHGELRFCRYHYGKLREVRVSSCARSALFQGAAST